MLINTDVLVWNLRGNEKATEALQNTPGPGLSLSVISYKDWRTRPPSFVRHG